MAGSNFETWLLEYLTFSLNAGVIEVVRDLTTDDVCVFWKFRGVIVKRQVKPIEFIVGGYPEYEKLVTELDSAMEKGIKLKLEADQCLAKATKDLVKNESKGPVPAEELPAEAYFKYTPPVVPKDDNLEWLKAFALGLLFCILLVYLLLFATN